MAITAGVQPDSGLSQMVLMGGELIWVSSPDYAARHQLAQMPREDLAHMIICETRYDSAALSVHDGAQSRRIVIPRQAIRVNDPICVRDAVIGGMGATLLPERYCNRAIAAGQLERVWRDMTFDQAAARLALLYPGRKIHSPRFRAVAEFLSGICDEN